MKLNCAFYPLTADVGRRLRQAKLSAAEWRIWSYFVEVDPFGDRYQDIDSLAVISECEVSRATFYRAIAKFRDLNLFDSQDKGFAIRNLHGSHRLKNENAVSEMRQDSQNCDDSLKNETTVSSVRQESHARENESLEPLPDKDSDSPQTIQTNKTNTDFSESERSATHTPNEEVIEAELLNEESSNNDEGFDRQPRQEQKDSLGGKSSAARLDELLDKFDKGEITKLPDTELRLLAGKILGEWVPLYRKSGRILSSRPNDIESDFKLYILKAHKDKKTNKTKDLAYPAALVRSMEEDPTKWGGLVDLVKGWQLEVNGHSNALADAVKEQERKENDARFERVFQGVENWGQRRTYQPDPHPTTESEPEVDDEMLKRTPGQRVLITGGYWANKRGKVRYPDTRNQDKVFVEVDGGEERPKGSGNVIPVVDLIPVKYLEI